MSHSPNPFTSIEERLDRIENLLLTILSSGEKLAQPSPQLIYGVDGLARLLNCSKPTAQRIKDSGKIPFMQLGRKIVFDEQAVLQALNKSKK
jgi:excisionase family DNA binding protein